MKQPIYLDYAASTPLDSTAEKAMRPYQSVLFANPSAIHLAGQTVSAAIHEARVQVAEAIGAGYREIVFTGSATEANNLALRGVLMQALRNQNSSAPAAELSSRSIRLRALARPSQSDLRDVPQDLHQYTSPLGVPYKILISAIEHESVRSSCAQLASMFGVEIVDIPVDNLGIIDLNLLKSHLDEYTLLVSVQYANSEIGVIQPIAEISRIIRDFRKDAAHPLFHTDAVQAFQYLPCDISALGVDLLTLSAHKIYGPKGVGALYVRDPELLLPQIVGGGQEYGMRSGSENVPAIVGFGVAAEIATALRDKESARALTLRNRLWEGIHSIVPDAELSGPPMDDPRRLPNNLSVYFPGHSAQDMCIELDMLGIAVSPGTACSSRTSEPSYVIEALGFSGDRPSSSIRFSLGRQTNAREIDEVLSVLKKRFA